MGKKPHKANGRAARERRQEDANQRHRKIEDRFGYRNGALDRKADGTEIRSQKAKRTITEG